MKKIMIVLSILFLLTSCGGENNKADNAENNKAEVNNSENNKIESKVVLEEYIIDETDFVDGANLIKDIEKTWDLTTEEKDGLILMREEEKLAQDVYITMYEKWGQNLFNNISKSEKTHMEAVLDLLNSYNIEDPIKNDTVWVFTSEKLQWLYDNLVAQWNKSLVDALMVGMTIEDLDIYDLDELSLMTTKQDILIVYDNLNRGSRNHMRAFYKNLVKQGWDYTPQFISADKYEDIINWSQEKGWK